MDVLRLRSKSWPCTPDTLHRAVLVELVGQVEEHAPLLGEFEPRPRTGSLNTSPPPTPSRSAVDVTATPMLPYCAGDAGRRCPSSAVVVVFCCTCDRVERVGQQLAGQLQFARYGTPAHAQDRRGWSSRTPGPSITMFVEASPSRDLEAKITPRPSASCRPSAT